MNNLMLSKQKVSDGIIDATVGEPYIIKDTLYSLLDIEKLSPSLCQKSIFDYSSPAGYEPLVKFLEDKYQAPVIISCGAKQAIGSLFYSLKHNNIDSIYLDNPWWSLFPPLISMHGLERELSFGVKDSAYLLVSPNNPDGTVKSKNVNLHIYNTCKENNIPIIHDSVYLNYNYLPRNHNLSSIGDVQTFSCSKLFGLSQLRVGYSVFHNTKLYNKAIEYMENMTVGVSVLSQMLALNIFEFFKNDPTIENTFYNTCFEKLSKNRNTLKNISESIVSNSNECGMFLWAKCSNLNAFKKAKINVVDGVYFGKPNYIRMNIAFEHNIVEDIVNRLNNL